jgi:hypothetical protein
MTRKALVWLGMSCMVVLALGCDSGKFETGADPVAETGTEWGTETASTDSQEDECSCAGIQCGMNECFETCAPTCKGPNMFCAQGACSSWGGTCIAIAICVSHCSNEKQACVNACYNAQPDYVKQAYVDYFDCSKANCSGLGLSDLEYNLCGITACPVYFNVCFGSSGSTCSELLQSWSACDSSGCHDASFYSGAYKAIQKLFSLRICLEQHSVNSEEACSDELEICLTDE